MPNKVLFRGSLPQNPATPCTTVLTRSLLFANSRSSLKYLYDYVLKLLIIENQLIAKCLSGQIKLLSPNAYVRPSNRQSSLKIQLITHLISDCIIMTVLTKLYKCQDSHLLFPDNCVALFAPNHL